MKNLRFEMISPEKPVAECAAELIVLPAVNGEMGILPGHAPFLVQVAPGEVRVTSEGAVRRFAVSGGFADVRGDKVSLFAETAEMADAIDTERAEQALEKAKAQSSRRDLDPLALAEVEAAMKRAQVRLRVAQLRRPMKARVLPGK